MRRGFDQPTSSAVSPSTSTETREQTQQPSVRTRQPQYEASSASQDADQPKRQQSISTRRKFNQQPHLPLPAQLDEPQAFSPGRRSPAYLQGKNPYGQILDKVEHPYREPIVAGPPSQVGATIEGRPRTSGSFQFKTRLPPDEPERTITVPDPQPLLSPPRQAAKPLSVQAAKKFFEAKASQNRPAPPLLPRGAATTAAGVSSKEGMQIQHPFTASRQQFQGEGARLTRISGPMDGHVRGRKDSDSTQPLPSMEATMQAERPRGVDPISRPKGEPSAADNVVSRAATFQGSSDTDNQQPDDGSESESSAAKLPTTHEKSPRSHRAQVSVGSVRRRSLDRPISAAESEEAPQSDHPKSHQKSQHTQTGRNVRRAFNDEIELAPRRLWRRGSSSALLISVDTASRVSKRLSSKPSTTDLHHDRSEDAYLGRFGETTDVRKKAGDIAARGLSHDGSSSRPISRRSSFSSPTSAANVEVEHSYFDIQVLDYLDPRATYGRRKTQDFGFPGARMKPRGTFRTYKPLQDAGNWLKCACGHFSYPSKGESKEDASRRVCRQCLARKVPSTPEPHEQHQTRRRAALNSPTSSCASSDSDHNSRRSSGRHHRHSECIPTDKCGDSFAENLSHIIDAILEEHASTLQHVINNIKHTQPSLSQLRRVSVDLVQRCQMGGTCTNPRHTSHDTSCCHQATCQPVCPPIQLDCEQVYEPQVYEWTLPFPCIPPRAAEKLNVGSTGGLGPNMNDSQCSLRETVRTISDLVDLLNSAADDLGVDLDRRPTANDEDEFLDAPVENVPQTSCWSRRSVLSETSDQKTAEEEQLVDGTWLQQIRRHLTELSEAWT